MYLINRCVLVRRIIHKPLEYLIILAFRNSVVIIEVDKQIPSFIIQLSIIQTTEIIAWCTHIIDGCLVLDIIQDGFSIKGSCIQAGRPIVIKTQLRCNLDIILVRDVPFQVTLKSVVGTYAIAVLIRFLSQILPNI